MIGTNESKRLGESMEIQDLLPEKNLRPLGPAGSNFCRRKAKTKSPSANEMNSEEDSNIDLNTSPWLSNVKLPLKKLLGTTLSKDSIIRRMFNFEQGNEESTPRFQSCRIQSKQSVNSVLSEKNDRYITCTNTRINSVSSGSPVEDFTYSRHNHDKNLLTARSALKKKIKKNQNYTPVYASNNFDKPEYIQTHYAGMIKLPPPTFENFDPIAHPNEYNSSLRENYHIPFSIDDPEIYNNYDLHQNLYQSSSGNTRNNSGDSNFLSYRDDSREGSDIYDNYNPYLNDYTNKNNSTYLGEKFGEFSNHRFSNNPRSNSQSSLSQDYISSYDNLNDIKNNLNGIINDPRESLMNSDYTNHNKQSAIDYSVNTLINLDKSRLHNTIKTSPNIFDPKYQYARQLTYHYNYYPVDQYIDALRLTTHQNSENKNEYDQCGNKISDNHYSKSPGRIEFNLKEHIKNEVIGESSEFSKLNNNEIYIKPLVQTNRPLQSGIDRVPIST